VVDLPEPVGPVTTTRPRCNIDSFFNTAGNAASNFSKSSKDNTLLGIWRNTAPMPYFWLKKLARNREIFGIFQVKDRCQSCRGINECKKSPSVEQQQIVFDFPVEFEHP